MQPQVPKLIQSLRINRGNTPPFVLRKGQFVTGTIIRFYPENKAMVQLGGKKLIAHLEKPLQANQRYMFQVKDVHPFIRLQVIGETALQRDTDQISLILEKLGLKAGKDQKQFLGLLLKENIPFQKDQLQRAFLLFNQGNSPDQVTSVLLEMFKRKMPIQEKIFQSLFARLYMPETLTALTEGLMKQLREMKPATKEGIQLYRRLSSLNKENRISLSSLWAGQLLMESVEGKETTFSFLQKAGVVSKQMTYSSWQKTWLNWAKGQGLMTSSGKLNGHKLLTASFKQEQLPFSYFSVSHLNSALEQMYRYQDLSQVDLNKVLHMIRSIQRTPDTYLQGIARLVSDESFQSVFKHLPMEPRQSLFRLQRKTEHLDQKQVFDILARLAGEIKKLMDHSLSQKDQHILKFWQWIHAASGEETDQNIFLSRLKGFMYLIKPGYEMDEYPSIPKLLSAVIDQDQNSLAKSQSNKMLQVLNGLMLSTLQDQTEPYRQFSLQIPGHMFGINQDVFVDFEGKKDRNGNLESDFCRVMFYLSMPHLDETVVDMNIQNKIVRISIYHSQPNLLKPMVDHFKESLKTGLGHQDYQLSSILVKPLHEDQPKAEHFDGSGIRERPDHGLDVKI